MNCWSVSLEWLQLDPSASHMLMNKIKINTTKVKLVILNFLNIVRDILIIDWVAFGLTFAFSSRCFDCFSSRINSFCRWFFWGAGYWGFVAVCLRLRRLCFLDALRWIFKRPCVLRFFSFLTWQSHKSSWEHKTSHQHFQQNKGCYIHTHSKERSARI